MQINQNPIGQKSTKKTLKQATVGGLSLSVLTLGLWFGGAAQADSQAAMQEAQEKATQTQDLRVLNTEMAAVLRHMRNNKEHTYKPQNPFAGEAADELVRYAVLTNDHFQPNVFTRKIPGLNDTAEDTAANENSIGLARMVVLEKDGVPTDANDPRSHIGVYVDVSGLKTIKAEAGWYEATMMYTTQIPPVAQARPDGRAQYGHMTPEDHAIMASQGEGYNGVIGHVFTKGGVQPRYPGYNDVWPADVNNLVTFPVTAGSFNALQGNDAHHYFELTPETNMVFPHQEFPFAGGVPALHPPEGSYAAGTLGHFLSIVPGSGPLGINDNDPHVYGDNPDDPRDPDRFQAVDMSQIEFRLRSVPSGLTEEIHRDVFTRRASFHPEETNLERRLYLSLAYEYSLIDTDGDGVLTFEELDINGESDGGQSNERLYFPVTYYDRFIIQREINDGLIVPRFANSQRAWVLAGDLKDMAGERIRDKWLDAAEGTE